MVDRLNTRQGLRSRHPLDIEEGGNRKVDENVSVSETGSYDDHSFELSRLGMLVTYFDPVSAPLRGRMIRCERRYCSCRRRHHHRRRPRPWWVCSKTNSTHETLRRSYFCQGADSVCRLWLSSYYFCRHWLSRNFINETTSPQNQKKGNQGTTKACQSLRTAEIDDQTPDVSLSGSSVLVLDAPKLLDYSKCRAPLPVNSPKGGAIGFLADYDCPLDDDDDASMDQYFHLHHNSYNDDDEWIQFSLRVPKSKLLLHDERRAADRKTELLEAARAHSPKGSGSGIRPRVGRRLRRRSNSSERGKARRRRSNSSDFTDVTPKRGYVAPFPIPISRENSSDRLSSMLPSGHGESTPNNSSRSRSKLSQSPKNTSPWILKPPFLNGADEGEEVEVPINDLTTHSASGGGGDIDLQYRQSFSDEEPEQERPRRNRLRMQRRSSFVAGSKIERFDGGSNQPNGGRARRSRNHQRRTAPAANNAESYAEWKLDLR